MEAWIWIFICLVASMAKQIGSLAESVFNRLAGLESGKQPSYGKRNQLIHDDINDPSFQFRRFSQE